MPAIVFVTECIDVGRIQVKLSSWTENPMHRGEHGRRVVDVLDHMTERHCIKRRLFISPDLDTALANVESSCAGILDCDGIRIAPASLPTH